MNFLFQLRTNLNMYSIFGYFVKCWYFNMDLLPNKISISFSSFTRGKYQNALMHFHFLCLMQKIPMLSHGRFSYLWSSIWYKNGVIKIQNCNKNQYKSLGRTICWWYLISLLNKNIYLALNMWNMGMSYASW